MMKSKYKLIALLFTVVCLFSSCASKQEYNLVWADEFEYEGLPDSAKWRYDTEGNLQGWGNNEDQYYSVARKENAWVHNGILSIHAIQEQYRDKDYTSARLASKADWQYGKVEVSAKLPDAKGTWSAIWMMPGGWSFNDGDWPNIGEIDMMEHVGHDLGVVHASAHSKDYQWQKNTQQTAVTYVENITQEFHCYTLEWETDVIRAYVDGQLYFTYKNEGLGVDKWPYDKPFYLILNLAVGGAWGSVQGIDAKAFPQTMEIDYVRIYQKTEK